MKCTIHRVVFLLSWLIYGLFLTACATYKVEVGNVSAYHEGVRILDSVKAKSKVRLEIGQNLVGGANRIPLAIFVSALNLSNEAVLFDRDNVSLYQNGKFLESLSTEELKNESIDYSYIIESYHLYIPTASMPSQPVGIPLIYRGYLAGFYFYDEIIFSARERMRRQIELDEQRMRKAIVLSSILRKNTLEKNGKPSGGFVIYLPSRLRAGEIELQVKVGEDKHNFSLQLTK